MKYTKEEVESFKELVCPICNKCNNDSYEHLIACPRIFNWKVLGKEDGVVRLKDC